MNVDLLREAAALMRERAEAATPGPWAAEDEQIWSTARGEKGGEEGVLHSSWEYNGEADSSHAASWHPAVALAVADWLEQHIDDHGDYDCRWEPCAAIAVARAYLEAAA